MKRKKYSYADAGVDRKLRAKSKEGLKIKESTYEFLRYGNLLKLPYGKIAPLGSRGRYIDLVIEGIGTKVLLAQLANKYDTIGIDAVAMATNDVIRSGAKPLFVADNTDAQESNPNLVEEWTKGIVDGATQAQCAVVGGETADVFDLMKNAPEREGKGFHIVCTCVGELFENDIIWGKDLKVGDSIIGIKSSGIHSNGVSTARKILFKAWGGKYDPFDIPDGFNREIVYETLEPTKIYVKPVLNVRDKHEIKAAVHITGDAYQKFDKLMPYNKGVGFEFYNFTPQPIFQLIQDTVPEVKNKIYTDEEMLKTFNMGRGFALIVEKNIRDAVIDTLGKCGEEAEEIGKVTNSGSIDCIYKGKKIRLV